MYQKVFIPNVDHCPFSIYIGIYFFVHTSMHTYAIHLYTYTYRFVQVGRWFKILSNTGNFRTWCIEQALTCVLLCVYVYNFMSSLFVYTCRFMWIFIFTYYSWINVFMYKFTCMYMSLYECIRDFLRVYVHCRSDLYYFAYVCIYTWIYIYAFAPFSIYRGTCFQTWLVSIRFYMCFS